MARKDEAALTVRYADMLSSMRTEPRLRIVRLLLSAHPEVGGRGDRKRVGYPFEHVVASPRKAQKRGLGTRAAGRHVPLVFGQHGGPSGIAWVPLRRVLHAEQGRAARKNPLLQIGGTHES